MSSNGTRALPTGWRWVQLGDCSEVIAGQSPPGSTYRNTPEGLPFFQGKADFGLIHPTPRVWCVEPTKIALPGDILISVRAPVGPTNIADVKCCIGRGLAAIRVSEKIDCDFLLSALRLYEERLAKQGSGSTFDAINRDQLEQLELPLPPLAEQRRIAAVLNEHMAAVERARAAAEARRDAARALPAALLRQVFESEEARGWERRRLGDICHDISDGTHFTPTYISQGVPFLSVKNVRETEILFEDCRFISQEQHENLCRRCKPERGDVLYTKVGTTGIAKAIDIDREFSIFVSVALLKIGTNVTPHYLEKVLNSPLGKSQAADLTQGMANRNLVIKDIKQIEVPVPSLPVQHRIVTTLNNQLAAAERAHAAAEAQLDAINALPAALLRKAFNGEL